MKSSADYVVLKGLYDGDDIGFASYLYKHYYYIVDKFYDKNNGVITKDNLEKVLIKSISEYIYKDYFNCNPSSYIYNCFINYEKKYLNKLKNDRYNLLIDASFNNDINARHEIFYSFMSIMDKKALEIYSKFNNSVDVDDIKQMIYLEMWEFINRFFDLDNKNKYLSRSFNRCLNQASDRIINTISKKYDDITNIDNVYYNDSYFVECIENKNILDVISNRLSDKEKIMFNYLRKGYTYEDAANEALLKRQSVGEMNNKIRKLVNVKGIKW